MTYVVIIKERSLSNGQFCMKMNYIYAPDTVFADRKLEVYGFLLKNQVGGPIEMWTSHGTMINTFTTMEQVERWLDRMQNVGKEA